MSKHILCGRFSIFANVLVLVAITFVSGCFERPATDAEKQATKSYLDCNWSKTIEYGSLWVKEDSDNPIPHALMNIAYTRIGLLDGVRSELKLAYGSSDRINKVKTWSANLVAKHNDRPSAYLLKGLVYEVSGDNQVAINSYRNAIAVDPSFKQAYQSLGNLYLANNELDTALGVFCSLMTKDPNYAPVYGQIALVYVMKNNTSKAIEYFEKSVKLDPDDVTGQYNLAAAYIEVGSIQKAIATLKKVIELDPNGSVGRDAKRRLVSLRE